MVTRPSTPPPRKRIFIVDDHPVLREGLVALIRRAPDLIVCGEADNVPQALSLIERLKPDLILADIGLPGRSGLELIKDLRALRPESPVLVLSMHDEALYAERVVRAGGRGYLMKQEGPEKILLAIRQVLNGQVYLSGKMASHMLSAFSNPRAKASSPLARLTDRELEILQLIGQGKDSHAIAKLLNLSFKTVDTHRGNIKGKLALKSGAELISYAARWVELQGTGRA